MQTLLRHSLKLALAGILFATPAFAQPQSQDPPPTPPPQQDPSQTPPQKPPAQQTQQPDQQPVPQQDTVHPKNSKEDVDAIGNRKVGSGPNFYSLEREIALGKALAQEVERSPFALATAQPAAEVA